MASKFFEHFVHIAEAMNERGRHEVELWDEQDGFYYDVLHLPNGERHYMKVRSLVGLIPLLAVGDFPGRISSIACPVSNGAWNGSSKITPMLAGTWDCHEPRKGCVGCFRW